MCDRSVDVVTGGPKSGLTNPMQTSGEGNSSSSDQPKQPDTKPRAEELRSMQSIKHRQSKTPPHSMQRAGAGRRNVPPHGHGCCKQTAACTTGSPHLVASALGHARLGRGAWALQGRRRASRGSGAEDANTPTCCPRPSPCCKAGWGGRARLARRLLALYAKRTSRNRLCPSRRVLTLPAAARAGEQTNLVWELHPWPTHSRSVTPALCKRGCVASRRARTAQRVMQPS